MEIGNGGAEIANNGAEIGNGGEETRYLESHAMRAAPKIGPATMLANPKGYGAKDSSPATDPANPNPSNPPIIIIIIMVIAAFLSPPCVSRTPPAPPVPASARR